MASLYPHRQTIVITIICALAVAGTATYAQWIKPIEKPQSAVVIPVKSNTTKVAPDSDSWKEQFFVNSANTVTTAKPNKQIVKTEEGPLTLTDKVGREFFTHYIDLRQSNLTTDDASVQSAVNNTLDRTLNAATQPKLYSATDIRISPDDDTTSVRAYGNAIGATFSSYGPRGDAAVITSNAFEKNDLTMLIQIDPIISAYQKTISAVLSLPVPAPLAEQHIKLINGLSSMLYVSQGLRMADKDPMQSMIALGTYNTAQTILRDAVQNMEVYFNSRGIFFSSNEPGLVFVGASSLTQ